MRPIVPRNVTEAAQTEVGLVRQSGGLQRVTSALAAEMARSDGAQLGVDQRKKTLQRAVITLFPRTQVIGDLEFRIDGADSTFPSSDDCDR
jgi:hypothetical protein